MDDLTAFVTARLDEDEAVAKAVEDNSSPWDGQWRPAGDYLQTCSGIVLAIAAGGGSDSAPGVIEHAGRHDPARALREVAAGRAILALHKICSEPEIRTTEHHDRRWNTGWVERQETGRLSYWCVTCDDDRDYGHIGGPEEGCPTVRALAAVWSDHPDYRQEWKP